MVMGSVKWRNDVVVLVYAVDQCSTKFGVYLKTDIACDSLSRLMIFSHSVRGFLYAGSKLRRHAALPNMLWNIELHQANHD